MRLSQLARTLKVTQAEIIEFLSQSGLQEAGASIHARLDEETVRKVVAHFRPDHDPGLVHIDERDAKNTDDPSSSAVAEDDTAGVQDNMITKDDEEPPDEIQDETSPGEPTIGPEADDTVEVVRAKKIVLPGIKVVGKIDLPEVSQKQKTVEKTEDSVPSEEQPASRRQPSHRQASELRKHPGKSRKHARKQTGTESLTYEEKLKRQQRAEARKQRESKKREKERKRQKYLASLKEKKDAQSRARQEKAPAPEPDTKPKHKNPIKRFWEWLNGEYDSF